MFFSYVRNMQGMFLGCDSLKEIDVSNLIHQMLRICQAGFNNTWLYPLLICHCLIMTKAIEKLIEEYDTYDTESQEYISK